MATGVFTFTRSMFCNPESLAQKNRVQKSPAELRPAGLRNREQQLPFAELEPLASARLAVFLAFAHARITGQQTFRAQRTAQIRIDGQQRAGNPKPDCAGLSVETA